MINIRINRGRLPDHRWLFGRIIADDDRPVIGAGGEFRSRIRNQVFNRAGIADDLIGYGHFRQALV